jgi:arylsulfatase A-like enzyme
MKTRRNSRRLRGTVLVPLAMLVGCGSSCAPEPRTPGAPEAVEVPGRDPLLEADAWTPEEVRTDRPPRVALLSPSFARLSTGGERAALLLPPPSSVTIEVRPEDGPIALRPKVGVGFRFRPARTDDGEPVRVAFEIQVNGAGLRTRTIETADDIPDEERDWEGMGVIELVPGDVVTLRTRLETPPGVEVTQRVRAGFSDLVFHRRHERQRQSATPETPNVVLIVMDTLRADALSCYGGEPGTTPHADKLAKRGVLFEEAYASASWTWPSTASILTGKEPDEHNVVSPEACYLNTEHQTLAEQLFARDYLTAAFSCNPLIQANKRFDQGFETFEDGDDFRFGDEVVPEVLDWLDEHAGSRFFLYLHLADPHLPYSLLPKFVDERSEPNETAATLKTAEKRIFTGEGHVGDGTVELDRVVSEPDRDAMRRRYHAAVRTGDHWLGEILDRLHELGLDGETLVVFTSDHGEELWDHGLGTHGSQLYEELVRVPLILSGPGVPRGERVRIPVSNRHLAPTLARVGGARFDGLTDPQDLLDPTQLEERPLFFSTHIGHWHPTEEITAVFGIRKGDWVLHDAPLARPYGARPDDDSELGQARLYHLGEDPQQLDDRAESARGRLEELRAELTQHVKQTGTRRTATSVGAGSETLKMLRDIGYVDDGDGDGDGDED